MNTFIYDTIIDTLKTVIDPEMHPVDVLELGLIYEVLVKENGNVKITMTLTAPACPVAGEIVQEIQNKVTAIDGVTDVHVQLTFDPPWHRDMMSDEAKFELGFL